MENKKSMFSYALNPGVILGIVLILIAVIIYVIGIDPMENKWAGIPAYFAIALVIFYSQKNYRDQQNNGFLSIGEAVKLGVTIAVIGGVFYAIYNIIFVTVIEPDFVEDMLLKTEEQILEQNPEITDDQLDMAMGISRKISSPALSIPLAIIGNAIVGLIFSLITGLILKKSDSPL